jgi:hypothetical protein
MSMTKKSKKTKKDNDADRHNEELKRALKQALADIKAGRVYTQAEIEKEFGL